MTDREILNANTSRDLIVNNPVSDCRHYGRDDDGEDLHRDFLGEQFYYAGGLPFTLLLGGSG